MLLRLTTALLFSVAFSVTQAGVMENSQGRIYKEIIISPQAPPMVKLAAKELQAFVEKTCKLKIPIITDDKTTGKIPYILIGQSKFTDKLKLTARDLKKEGFKIVSTSEYLAIIGRDRKGKPVVISRNPWREREIWNGELGLCALGEAGTLYGVYRFLEDQLGVRWYWPNKYGTVIQNKGKIVIPEFTLIDAPRVNYRYPWYCAGEVEGQQLLWLRRARFGGTFPVHIVHSFKNFLKHKDTHPEYFALVNGKRDFNNLCAIGGGGHLCLTNPAVIAQYAKDIREYINKHPNQDVYPLVPNDGLMRICGCADCQAEADYGNPSTGRFSNHIWGFVNKVAKEVAKTHPEKLIGCLAYSRYRDPPSRIEHLNYNVAVMICYSRNEAATPYQGKYLKRVFMEWKKRCDNIYTWNWYLEHWRSWKGLPIGNSQLIKDEYKFLDSLKVWKGEFIEAEDRPKNSTRMVYPASQHINLYLSGRAMWNPDFDVRKTMEEYYRLFYGPAEDEMRKFWQLSEKAYMQAAAKIDKENARLVPEDAYTPEILGKLNSYLNTALKKTSENSEYHQRLLQIQKEFKPAYDSLIQLISKGNRKLEVKKIQNVADLKKLKLQRFVTRKGFLPEQQTYFSAGWDDKNLYFIFYCFDSEMKSLKMQCLKRDDNEIFGEDCIEIFISPELNQPENCFHFCVNAKGTLWDARHAFGGPYNKDWNCGDIKVKVERQEHRWILQVSIPVKSLDLKKISNGQEFLANFYRSRVAGGVQVFSCWSPIFSPVHFSPNRFGKLEFIAAGR